MKLKKNHIIIGGTILCIAAVYGAVLPTKARPFDERTEKVLSELEPATALKARRFLDAARKAGIDLRAISGRRTCAQQDQLYAQGRTAPGNIVTKARCGQSAHNYGLAIDVVEFINGVPAWDSPNWEVIGRFRVTLQ